MRITVTTRQRRFEAGQPVWVYTGGTVRDGVVAQVDYPMIDTYQVDTNRRETVTLYGLYARPQEWEILECQLERDADMLREEAMRIREIGEESK